MARDYEQELCKVLFQNMNISANRSGAGMITGIFGLATFVVGGLLIMLYKAISAYITYQKDNNAAAQQAKRQMRDDAILSFRNLVIENGSQVWYSILKDSYDTRKNVNVMHVKFFVFSQDVKQYVDVSHMINTLMFNKLKVSVREGSYLKSSIIINTDELEELEKQLIQIIQVPFRFTLP